MLRSEKCQANEYSTGAGCDCIKGFVRNEKNVCVPTDKAGRSSDVNRKFSFQKRSGLRTNIVKHARTCVALVSVWWKTVVRCASQYRHLKVIVVAYSACIGKRVQKNRQA